MKFTNKPPSNFNLKNWVKRLGIKHLRGIFSRDNLPLKMKEKETGIINLDSKIGPGTHWVCYRNGQKYAECFDSLGINIPEEVAEYLATSKKQIIYSGETRERFCSLWILGSLLFGRSILNTIHNVKFEMNDQGVNHSFIINYFKQLYKIISLMWAAYNGKITISCKEITV